MSPLPDRFEVGVIGAGAWGTALAIHAARTGHPTVLWAYEPQVVAEIDTVRENQTFLRGHRVPDNLWATGDLERAVRSARILLTVMPTPHVARLAGQMLPYLDDDHCIVSCSKGIDNESLETVNEIFERVLPRRLHLSLAYLSGPSFAAEVAAGMPTAVTIAAIDRRTAKFLQKALSSERFRCYTSNDVIGVEMGGALKNVMAIAVGAADGLGFGHNARAGLITRGLGEITRLAVKKGGNPLTMQGLAGMGDLVLTCTGDLSRNRTVGIRLGKGETIDQILGSMTAVAEGVLTAKSAHRLAVQLGVEAPIIEHAYKVLYEGLAPRAALEGLMSRPLKDELVL
ncbi:MAG: NAD(P)-dependent glycerol-3-phosphate dehydrogenase [Deltaproteobacteria bacterium]|nr:NAD(P)-dependent glycerol-3-phosphate dehydrogenase [Deltaproteobacteria bacterium]